MRLSTAITILMVGVVLGYTWAHKAHWNSRQAFCEQIAEINAKATPPVPSVQGGQLTFLRKNPAGMVVVKCP